eukprot:gene16910-17097_t
MQPETPPQAALALRYGPEFPQSGPWNATIAGLLGHRSVRAYRPDPLPPGTVETLVAAAQSAATSSNLQLWSVVAVKDAATRARLAEIAGGQLHIVEAPLILLFVADLARPAMIAEDAACSATGYDYLESYTVAAIDAALAAQNAVVAAESLGLGTVYIGAMRNDPAAVAALIGLPPRAAVVFGLVVGHADPARPAAVKPRLPQAAVLHHEVYALDAQRAPIAAYDDTARAFQTAQGQKPVGWRALIITRGRDAAALNGRDKLKAVLRLLGFALR